MANSKLIETKNGPVYPAVLWSFGFAAEIRKPATMPADFPRRIDEIEKLEGSVRKILDERIKLTPPTDIIDCACGREVPDYPDILGCPFCGVKFEAADEDEDEDEDEEATREEGDGPIDVEYEEKGEALVPASAQELAKQTLVTAQTRELNEIEADLARWTGTEVRAFWERGRLLTRLRDRKLYTVRGCKTFQVYLAEQAYGVALAYRYMAFFEACHEDALTMCEGMSFAAMFAFARQSASAVKNLADGAEVIHGVFRQFVEAAEERKQLTGKTPTAKEVLEVVAEAKNQPGTPAGEVVERASKSGRSIAVSPAAKRAAKRGRPRKEESRVTPSESAPTPTPMIESSKKSVVPKLMTLGLDKISSPGEGAYINPASGRPIARPGGNLVNRCIHLRGSDGKFLRIKLGKNSYTWTVETEP